MVYSNRECRNIVSIIIDNQIIHNNILKWFKSKLSPFTFFLITFNHGLKFEQLTQKWLDLKKTKRTNANRKRSGPSGSLTSPCAVPFEPVVLITFISYGFSLRKITTLKVTILWNPRRTATTHLNSKKKERTRFTGSIR